MTYVLGKRSRERLEGVHDDLVKVVELAISYTSVDFSVLEGVRTPERQQKLFEAGASQTLNSRHITGHAVDLGAYIDGGIAWDWPLYDKIAAAMKRAAAELGIPIVWGGDWTTLKDGPHFELDRRHYSA